MTTNRIVIDGNNWNRLLARTSTRFQAIEFQARAEWRSPILPRSSIATVRWSRYSGPVDSRRCRSRRVRRKCRWRGNASIRRSSEWELFVFCTAGPKSLQIPSEITSHNCNTLTKEPSNPEAATKPRQTGGSWSPLTRPFSWPLERDSITQVVS